MVSVPVRTLVRQCARGEDAGWEQIWKFVEEAVPAAVRLCLAAPPGTVEDADDFRQELFLYLRQYSTRRLQLFRGTTEAEFRCFLQVLAIRFVGKRQAREGRRRQRERAAWTARGVPRPGPTLADLQARTEELEAVLSPADLHRWRLLMASPESVDGRTRRRWFQNLAKRYADRLV